MEMSLTPLNCLCLVHPGGGGQGSTAAFDVRFLLSIDVASQTATSTWPQAIESPI